MKVIELLNKIANGEEVPKKIKISNYIYHFDIDESQYTRFINDDLENPRGLLENINLYNAYVWFNLDVEIIEDKPEKIEKIEPIKMVGCNIEFKIGNEKKLLPTKTMQFEIVINKINEVIDKVNDLLEKSDNNE